MENNEEQNIVDKAQEAAQMAKEASQLAANLASGNYMAAIKNAVNLLKNKQFRKALKRELIMALIKAMIPIMIALCFFGVLNAMKDKMIDILANAGTAMRGFIAETWQWMTDDYWIKLEEKVEYIVDADTGEVLGTKYTIKDEDLLDANGNPRNTTTEKYTIVDQYVKELGNQGISLKDLRLLGDADYSDEEKLLENEENKALVEKYISEFIRADIITQQPHKRRDEKQLVQKDNQNHVDGGVYFYRTTNEAKIDINKFTNGSLEEPPVELSDKDYKEMKFLSEEEFMTELGYTGDDISTYVNTKVTLKEGKANDLRYNFTISKKTGELILLETSTTIHKEENEGIPIGEWFKGVDSWYNDSENQVTVKIKSMDYKEYISKYSMPYEFLINLCEVTQNPEFVYHVALLARDTRIDLVIHDNTTIDRETNEIEEDHQTYVDGEDNDIKGASLVGKETIKTRKGTLTITQTPVLKVRYANTWSFHEEYVCTKTVKGTLTEGPINTEKKEPGPILSGYYPGEREQGTQEVYGAYWYDDYVVETRTNTQLLTMTTTYNEPILKAENSGEKSKQFLGMLRNDTGKCVCDDCYQEGENLVKKEPKAIECAEEAEFDRHGINVQYRIPNMTRTEAPLNRLTSGIEMLYSALQSNSSGYDESDKLLEDIEESYDEQDKYIAEKDFESAYVVKMQGLVEHLRYLMTFPENENFDIKDDPTDDDDDGDDKEEDYTEDELDLLYRVCEAEAGGSSESEIGHVASVVLNRVRASKWPNTITEVILQPNQFTSVQRSDFYEITISEKTKRAVDYVIKNGDTTGGAYYFRTKQSALDNGMPTSKNEEHDFYIFLFIDPNTHCFYTDKDLGTIVPPIKKDSYIVTIDAGHGPKPEGAITLGGYWAVGGTKYYMSGTQGTYNGVTYTEHETARKVADKIASILASNPKISPVRIGNSAANPVVKNSDRIPMAKNANSDLHVTIHFNGGTPLANGTECLATPGDLTSIMFGNIVTDSVCQSLGTNNRGVKSNQSWAIIQSSYLAGFPNIIVEGLFMSNPGDMKILANGGIDKYAQGVANGILQYLGV